MHAVGQLFPRGDRSPAIHPVSPRALRRALAARAELGGFVPSSAGRVKSGFYICDLMSLVRA
jgi:magnesium-protoporphyrin O-methyltransferase